MNILLQHIHYPVSSGLYMARALRRMGHTVYSTGWSTGNMIWNIVAPTLHLPMSPPQDFQPDLVIIADSDSRFFDKRMEAAHPTVTVVYGVDNHVRDYHYADSARRRIDHFFFAHNLSSCIDMSKRNITWLPCAYDPELHTPSAIPYRERRHDIAFAGVMYQQRQVALRRLQGLSIDARLAFGEDYAEMYRNARISLNWSAARDVPNRLFEAIATQNVFLTDTLADLSILKYADDFPADQIVQVDSVAELSTVAKAQAAREIDAFETSWISRQRWDDRMQVIVDWL